MRKSFILSLVMVVVLIASLATATFAWYTAQTEVTATGGSATTAEVSKNLVIKKNALIDSLDFTGKTVAFTMTSTPVDPMILAVEPSNTASSETTLDAFTFKTFTLDSGKIGSTVIAGVPAKFDTSDTTVICLANTGKDSAAYTATVTIDTDVSNNGLRVAIFVAAGQNSASAADSAYKLVGIWAAADEFVGFIEDGKTLATNDTINASGLVDDKTDGIYTGEAPVKASGSSQACGTLAKLDPTSVTNDLIKVVAWFEGDKVTNNYQNKNATFSIAFNC